MSKWKPWQQMVFLGYLLLLNLIIFGTLAFLVFNSQRRNSTQPPVEMAAASAPNALVIYSTITPSNEVALLISPTPIPPLNIPPAPLPQPTAEAIVTPQAVALVEGSRSRAWTATPTSTATPQPTPTSTSTRTPTQAPRPTATPTFTPLPTATSTPTPLPTSTPTRRPTSTSQPTATLTPRSTNTPQPTLTPTQTPTQVAQALINPTHTPAKPSKPTATPTRTPSPTVTTSPPSTHTPKPTTTSTRPPSPTVPATVTMKLTPTPLPTDRPSQQPTPLVVAAALKSNSGSTSLEASAPRLAQPDLSVANTADMVDAIPLTNASIALSWLPTGKTTRYRIYSDMGSGYGVYIHKAEVNEPAFVDKALRAGMNYSYRVTRLEAKQEVVLAQTDAATFSSQTLTDNLSNQRPVITATVAPAPTALPPDAVLLGLLSDNSFIDEFNTLNIVGEVRNDSNLDVGQTDIAITFYDTAGAAIGTANGATILDIIPPGEISPFLITLSRPQGMVSYSVRAVARPVKPELSAQLSVIQVKRFEDDTGFFHVQGVVENTGSATAKRAKVVAVIYGRGGGVINVGFTYLTPPTLAPGERASYEVIFTYFPKYVSQKVIPFEE